MTNILAWVVGVLFGMAATDFWGTMQRVETESLQGTCKPDRVQVVHMDGARQVTVMVQKGVDCLTILEGVR